jgi:hypothetical protein
VPDLVPKQNFTRLSLQPHSGLVQVPGSEATECCYIRLRLAAPLAVIFGLCSRLCEKCLRVLMPLRKMSACYCRQLTLYCGVALVWLFGVVAPTCRRRARMRTPHADWLRATRHFLPRLQAQPAWKSRGILVHDAASNMTVL